MSEAQVFVPDAEAAWARASVLQTLGDNKFEVRIDGIDDNDETGESTWGAGEVRTVDVTAKEFGGGNGTAGDAGNTLPLQNLGVAEDGVEDMTRLNYLHEPAILFNLRKRFFRALPYTYTGDIVIACNPYRWLDLYGEDRRRQYAGMVRGDRARLPPHVYSTSAVAFAGLSKERENQSILVSGESGAGKTETVKILMGHLAVASAGGDASADGHEVGMLETRGEGKEQRNSDVIQKIIESNPLLESFGNAQTTRNDNSSRFGKFTQLQFDAKFRMAGSGCTTYLLEKSRVVGHEPGERGYHIFYQLTAAPEEDKELLGLSGKVADDFRYLTADGKEAESVIEGRTDAQRYVMTTAALGLIGVNKDETHTLFRALAGVLYLGQAEFQVRDGDDDKSEVIDNGPLSPASALLGISAEGEDEGVASLESALCYRTIRARNDVLRADNSPAQAVDARDAMAKAVYGRIFDWLVGRINQSTAARASGSTETPSKKRKAGEALAPGGTVALLDIFGFESFKVNRFEQLCINYANEKLQQKFTLDVFKTVQVEYEEEGIPWSHVDFSDNAEVLGLVESKMGIIAVLNEECVRPRGSDQSFVSKLATLHNDHPAFSRAKLAQAFEFSVKHYAGEVLYHAEGFMDKNRDAVGEACKNLLAQSSVPLISNIFASQNEASNSGDNGRGGSGGAPQRKSSMATNTLATKFKDNLTHLMDTIGRTSVQYVRCIKPNAAKLPGRMENAKVAEQLRCAGVIEAIRISRAAYPNRMTRLEFNKRFQLLAPRSTTNGHGVVMGNTEAERAMSMCKAILTKLLPREAEDEPLRYEMGRTRVYFRAGALEKLEAVRLAERASQATVLQAVARMWPRWLQYRRLLDGAKRAQAEWRRVSARRRYVITRQQIILVQACWRRVQSSREALRLRRNRAAAQVQAGWRMVNARRRYLQMQAAAIVVQTWVRMVQARRAYLIMVVESREAAKLENQIASLQKKLDEERKARQEMEEAHRQLAIKAEAASAAAESASRNAPSSESSISETATARQQRSTSDASKEGSEPGRLTHADPMTVDGRKNYAGDDSRSGGDGPGFGEAMMSFFSPRSQARAKRLLHEEDQRRGTSLDIMGESSQIIAALKAERDKYRKESDTLKKSHDDLRRELQREKKKALSTYEASGMSYHALNQTVKSLSAKNQRLTAENRQMTASVADEKAAMMEVVQRKTEESSRREEEGKTMRLLYESEVTKGKNKLRVMETMVRLVAETSTPMDAPEKDDLVLDLMAMYKECMLEDPNVVSDVDRMMSTMGIGQIQDRATSVISSAKGMVSNFFGGKKKTNVSI